jgi:WD40 domain-containing protein
MTDGTLERNVAELLRRRAPDAAPSREFLSRLDRLAATPRRDRTGFLPLALIAAVVLAAILVWVLRTTPDAAVPVQDSPALPPGALMRLGPDGKNRVEGAGIGGPVVSIAVSPDGRQVASGTQGGVVRLWDLETGEELWRGGSVRSAIMGVEFVGDWLVVMENAGVLFLDLPTRQRAVFVGETVPPGERAAALFVQVSAGPEAGQVTVVGVDGGVSVLEVSTGRGVRSLAKGGEQTRAAVVRGGRLFTAGRTVRVVDLETQAVLGETERLETAVYALAASRDGSMLVTVGRNVQLLLADAQEIWRVSLEIPVQTVALSPDDVLIAIGTPDGVRILESWTGQEVQRLDARGVVGCFTSDGRLLTGSPDSSVTVWSTKPGTVPGGTLEELWAKLADGKATTAYAAQHALAGKDAAANFIAQQLSMSSPVDASHRKLIAKLDSDDIAEREAAERELAKGEDDGALLERLAQNPAAETKARIESILARTKLPPYRGATLQRVRAVQALALMRSDASRRALESLAKDSPWAAVRARAKAALR